MRDANRRYRESPVVIIGAARSGTKILRDLIGSHPDFRAVPFDINYVWRIGNEHIEHDELEPNDLKPQSMRRINRYLAGFRDKGHRVVEKTVSNALRVDYVERVLPGPCYVHLVRDGRDVVASAYRQWTAPTDWRYMLRKSRRYPFALAPGYVLRKALAIAGSRAKLSRSVSVWGPAYRGIHDDLRSLPLLEVCCRQWVRCAQSALDQLAKVPVDRVFHLRYEDLVADAEQQLVRIASFLDVDPGPFLTKRLSERVTARFVGSYSSRLIDAEAKLLEELVGRQVQHVDGRVRQCLVQ